MPQSDETEDSDIADEAAVSSCPSPTKRHRVEATAADGVLPFNPPPTQGTVASPSNGTTVLSWFHWDVFHDCDSAFVCSLPVCRLRLGE